MSILQVLLPRVAKECKLCKVVAGNAMIYIVLQKQLALNLCNKRHQTTIKKASDEGDHL